MTKTFKITDNLINFSDIEVFEMVRSGTIHTFPRDFWTGFNTLDTSKNITKYLFEKKLNLTIDDIKQASLSDIFYDNRLGSMIKKVFDGSTIKAIINAYPELEDYYKTSEYESANKESLGRTNTKLTDEELIELLQQLAKELNRNPYSREAIPEPSVFINRFGTWEKSLMAAGLLEDIYKDLDISEEAGQSIMNKLKKYVFINEKLPTKDEVLEFMSEGELKTYFRSYKNLCYLLENDYNKNELIQIMKHKQASLERLPEGRDMKIPRAIKYIQIFGSFENALIEAGLM